MNVRELRPKEPSLPGAAPERPAATTVANAGPIPGPERRPPAGNVLSAPGGKHPAPENIRRNVVFTDEGLWVSQTHTRDMHVLSYAEYLRVRGERFSTYVCALDEITSAYAGEKAVAHVTTRAGAHESEHDVVLSWFAEGVRENASDVHVIIGAKDADVRMRIMGELETRHGYPAERAMALVSSMYGTMCAHVQGQFNFRVAQSARLHPQFTANLGLYGARINTSPRDALGTEGLLVVMRLLKRDDRVLTHQELGFLPQQEAAIKEIMLLPNGVFLISGPTGSGKSRTLQTSLSYVIAHRGKKINVLTLEDPVEYFIDGANQRTLDITNRGNPAAVSAIWRTVIADSLRLDPDIVMVGEIRDNGSAATAITGAKTGHLLPGTIHANDATSIVSRLLTEDREKALAHDVFDPTLMVGFSAQRLLPRLCDHCKIPFASGRARLSAAVVARLLAVLPPGDVAGVYVRGDGCARCRDGRSGRALVAEVIQPTMGFMETFERAGALAARRYWATHEHGITILRHALWLIAHGKVDPANAEAAVGPLDRDLNILGAAYAVVRELA